MGEGGRQKNERVRVHGTKATLDLCQEEAPRMRYSLEKREGQKDIILAFIDLTKAYGQGPGLYTFFEDGSVLNSQSVLRNDVTSYALPR